MVVDAPRRLEGSRRCNGQANPDPTNQGADPPAQENQQQANRGKSDTVANPVSLSTKNQSQDPEGWTKVSKRKARVVSQPIQPHFEQENLPKYHILQRSKSLDTAHVGKTCDTDLRPMQHPMQGTKESHADTTLPENREPNANGDSADAHARALGFGFVVHGGPTNTHIWLFWNNPLQISDIVWRERFVTYKCLVSVDSGPLQVTIVYGTHDQISRHQLWEDIAAEGQALSIPWFVMGDFNTISDWSEKQGGDLRDDGSMLDFNTFQVRAGLSDLGFSGNPFTWSNNQGEDSRVWERLDRVLANGQVLSQFPAAQVTHLPHIMSDHCPLLLHSSNPTPRPSRFFYQKMWHSHPGFSSFVQHNWDGKLHNNPLLNFGLKLKRLRQALKIWNWQVFGNINVKQRALASRIGVLEIVFTQLDLLQTKAKMAWVLDGDRNSTLFHAAIKARRQQAMVNLDVGDGIFTNDTDLIGSSAADFFSSLFQGHTPPPPASFFADIEGTISLEDNTMLCRLPTEDEIYTEIQGMNQDSSPGPDGFTGHFYTHNWSIIKEDLCQAMHGFFQGLGIPPIIISSTLLTLIPKVPIVTMVSQLRPISLCNFVHKIISRLINSRLANVLPKVISSEQAGFIHGRNIHENISLAHDLTHELNEKSRGGNVIISIDMTKAYDKVSWSFLISMLRHLRFNENWCDLIFRCISNCWYSVLWGGKMHGYFKSSQGVRQGDPLSPSLFLVAVEYFSRKLNLAVDKGELAIIADFCTHSGQSINLQKTKIFFSSSIREAQKTSLLQLTGFSEGVFPITYLGAPLFRGAARIDFFDYLVDKVLSAMPMHVIARLLVPKTTLRRIESIMSNFIWDQGAFKRRHWISWQHLCRSKGAGGLGVHSLIDMQMAFKGKLGWAYISADSLWARFMRSKYIIGSKGSPA
ncbi:hypothetical protein QQ045_029625 [Rhodiola kirilowii]